jgi:protein-tyrosine phosphatase
MQHSKNFTGRKEVPDPYFGGHQGFEEVLDMVEEAGLELLNHILNKK